MICHMKTEEDVRIIDAMIQRGGSFVRALGQAALRADDDNLARIKSTWPEYWEYYKYLAEKAKNSDNA